MVLSDQWLVGYSQENQGLRGAGQVVADFKVPWSSIRYHLYQYVCANTAFNPNHLMDRIKEVFSPALRSYYLLIGTVEIDTAA